MCFRKQFATMEHSAEAVESRLKDEINLFKAANNEKYNELKKELELEKERYDKKVVELTERHKDEIQNLRENHNRVIDEIKYEYNTIIDNIKQSKLTESSVFENITNYNDKLDNNLQLLGINSKVLIDLKEKVEKDYGILSIAREESLKVKEEEIKSKCPIVT